MLQFRNQRSRTGASPSELDTQVADLKAHLALANEREASQISERAKLIDLFSDEKAEKRALMPAVEVPPPRGKRKGFIAFILSDRKLFCQANEETCYDDIVSTMV